MTTPITTHLTARERRVDASEFVRFGGTFCSVPVDYGRVHVFDRRPFVATAALAPGSAWTSRKANPAASVQDLSSRAVVS
jgi:hypothetical protein